MYEDWSEVKKEYRAWGWGMFGNGLALTPVGTGIWFADDLDNINKIIFTPLVSLGSLAVVTGVTILIYNDYKFGMDSQYGMQFQPEIMLSPQMTGLGVSERF